MSEQKLAEASPGQPLLPRQPEVNIGTAGHVDHGKCLAWDQYVLLNGVPVTGSEIERLVSQTGRLLTRVDGGEVYEFDGNEVVSVDSDFVARPAKSLFYVQEYRGQINRIRTKTGRTISVTPEHPLLANRNGSLEWVKSKDLKAGDRITFLSQVPLGEGVSAADPFPQLERRYQLVRWEDYRRLAAATDDFKTFSALGPSEIDQLRILAGASCATFGKEVGFDAYKRWKGILCGESPLDLRTRAKMVRWLASARFKALEPGEFCAVQRAGAARHIRRLKEFDLDDELLKWLAFVWSEGTSDETSVGVTQTDEVDMLSQFLEITKRKLGMEVHTYPRGQFRISCAPFVDYLRFKLGFAPGNKSESPISAWVCRLPLSQKATFLSWFFSLDGEFNRKAGQVSIAQANRQNIVIISYLLGSFGIVARFGVAMRRVKGGERTYHRLTISGRRNLRLFADSIGFESRRKQGALTGYLGRIKKEGKESDLGIPVDVPALRQLLRRSGLSREAFAPSENRTNMKTMTWYRAYEGMVRTGLISRPKLLQLVQSLQDHLGDVEDALSKASRDWGSIPGLLSMSGIPLEHASHEMGMSRKKLVRILNRPTQRERVAVLEAVTTRVSDLLREVRPAVRQLANLASAPLEFDRVSTITAEPYEGKVFDLTVPEYANFVAGVGALVSHNSSLTQALTGVWTSAHSEELKRGITIKVGYADAAFYRCSQDHGVGSYSTSSRCPVCGRDTSLLRAVSFVDCPGHESLMANMLAGAFLMDGALLVIAANETVPKPQTREHLQALQMLGMKKIVIAQNKIDLVTDQEAVKNHEQIQKFVKGTVAADAPIVPISAQQKLNIDALVEAIEEVIPTPKRDAKVDPLMYVVRSFDVNRPGAEIESLSGGVLGGSLTRGELKIGEEIELRPGMVDERSGKFVPIVTKVSSLQTGAGPTERVGPGGLVAVGTHLDPTFIKGDQMVGSVIGKPGTLPETLEHVTLDVSLLDTAVGSADLIKVEKVRLAETVRLNLGTASTLATTTSVRGDVVELDLKKPVAIETGMRAAMSRRIAERWRLIGSGVLK